MCVLLPNCIRSLNPRNPSDVTDFAQICSKYCRMAQVAAWVCCLRLHAIHPLSRISTYNYFWKTSIFPFTTVDSRRRLPEKGCQDVDRKAYQGAALVVSYLASNRKKVLVRRFAGQATAPTLASSLREFHTELIELKSQPIMRTCTTMRSQDGPCSFSRDFCVAVRRNWRAEAGLSCNIGPKRGCSVGVMTSYLHGLDIPGQATKHSSAVHRK